MVFFSEMISVKNGVKQGGILSPILFCIYFDNLINKLVNSSVGCYMGHLCLAVLAYADYVVILAPTASAAGHLLSLCDELAVEFDVKFNAAKSKCIYFPPLSHYILHKSGTKPCFSVGGSVIDYADSWPHLGHILNNHNTDCDDIINRRNVLVRQANDVICYFAKLSPVVKLRLLYSYCSSLYGAELWNLNSPELAAIGVSWRKALKRVWNLPFGTHSHILYALCGKWSIEDEVRRRCLRFIVSCLSSNCSIVRDVVKMCFTSFPATSLLGSNVLYCASEYNANISDLLHCNTDSVSNILERSYFCNICNCRDFNAGKVLPNRDLLFILETLFARDRSFYIDFNYQQLQDIIISLCTN